MPDRNIRVANTKLSQEDPDSESHVDDISITDLTETKRYFRIIIAVLWGVIFILLLLLSILLVIILKKPTQLQTTVSADNIHTNSTQMATNSTQMARTASIFNAGLSTSDFNYMYSSNTDCPISSTDQITQAMRKRYECCQRQEKPWIAWSCKGVCGGVGDRFRAIMDVFTLALDMCIPFYIKMNWRTIWTYPNALEFPEQRHIRTFGKGCDTAVVSDAYDFFVRPEHWGVGIQNLKVETNCPMQGGDLPPHKRYDKAFWEKVPEDTLLRRGYLWPVLMCMDASFMEVVHKVESEVVQFMAARRLRHWISIHLRTGDKYFNGGIGAIDSRAELKHVFTMLNCAEKLERKMYGTNGESAFVFASDNMKARALAVTRKNVFVAKITPHHVERRFVQSIHQQSSWIEIMILSKGDGIVRSSGGYASVAAAIGLIPSEFVYNCINQTYLGEPVSAEDLAKLQNFTDG